MKPTEKKERLNALAKAMFKKYVLLWKLKFVDRLKAGAIGQCNYWDAEILILNDAVELYTIESLEDILKHEMAHAILGMAYMGHNKMFRQMCEQIGCKGNRPRNRYEFEK